MKAILAAVALCACCCFAFGKPTQAASQAAPELKTKAPEVTPQQKPDGGLKQQEHAQANERTASAPKQERRDDAAASHNEPPETYVAFGKSLKVTDSLIAVFTFLIAIFTIGLFFEAKSTSKKELRAYVGISRAFFRRTDANWLVAEIDITNVGKTPAKAVRLRWHYHLEIAPQRTDGVDEDRTGGVLMPGLIWRTHQDIQIGQATERLIERGDALPLMHGRIEYIDAFDEPRWTTFQFASGRQMGADGWDVRSIDDAEHRNDAT